MQSKVVSVEQMLAIEREADARGLSYDLMMANAGKAIATAILDRWPECAEWKIVVLAGSGNNGGDGLVAAHHLAEAGAQVSVYLSRARDVEDSNIKRLVEGERKIISAEEDAQFRSLKDLIETSDLVIDALLGTGFQLPLKDTPKKILVQVQSTMAKLWKLPLIVAVDCPSGLNCDTGEIAEEALHADLTVTLAAAKTGQFTFPGAGYVGDLQVADIGIDPQQESLRSMDLDLADFAYVKPLVPARSDDSHKGTFGRVIIVAGSVNYPGALAMAGGAAYRVGSGLVTLAGVRDIYSGLISVLPEATWILLPEELGVIGETAAPVLIPELAQASALLIGPGFGLESTTKTFLERIFAGEAESRAEIGFVSTGSSHEAFPLPPCVVDADGLKLLVELDGWTGRLPAGSILTPHPGEMSIMTGLSVKQIQAERRQVAVRYAREWGHVVVLKGAYTIIAAAEGRNALLPFATSALAKAGTGDVLAGTIAGLLGQGMEAFNAAVLGCWLHARAGVLAGDWYQTKAGVVAGDLIEFLPMALAELEGISTG